MMWTDIIEFILGLVFYQSVRHFIYGQKQQIHSDFTGSNYLFSVADRLQTLYGGKAYVGLRIPDPDTASRQSIDLVHVTKKEVAVVSVINASSIISVDGDGSLVRNASNHKTERVRNTMLDAGRNVAVLESYLELRGVTLPGGFLSFKTVCVNSNSLTIHQDCFLPEVVTYGQWVQLKPVKKSTHGWIKGVLPVHKSISCLIKGALPAQKSISGSIKRAFPFTKRISIWIKGALPVKKRISAWIKGLLSCYKNEKEQSLQQNIGFVLSTAPMWDRLELDNDKHLLGEFLEFKGKNDDITLLRDIKKSKVSRIIIQKTSVFGLDDTKFKFHMPREITGVKRLQVQCGMKQ